MKPLKINKKETVQGKKTHLTAIDHNILTDTECFSTKSQHTITSIACDHSQKQTLLFSRRSFYCADFCADFVLVSPAVQVCQCPLGGIRIAVAIDLEATGEVWSCPRVVSSTSPRKNKNTRMKRCQDVRIKKICKCKPVCSGGQKHTSVGNES